jgi:pimeloyl-ACP methyl ester carboxylesterase
MFRDLIPLLADRYHLIAPDYPGFGHSARPKATEVDSAMEEEIASPWRRREYRLPPKT